MITKSRTHARDLHGILLDLAMVKNGLLQTIIIIIIISIFKEDNVFSIIASLPHGPPKNTDIDYYQTFFRTFIFCKCCDDSCAMFIRRREASACLIILSTKQGSHWYHF